MTRKQGPEWGKEMTEKYGSPCPNCGKPVPPYWSGLHCPDCQKRLHLDPRPEGPEQSPKELHIHPEGETDPVHCWSCFRKLHLEPAPVGGEPSQEWQEIFDELELADKSADIATAVQALVKRERREAQIEFGKKLLGKQKTIMVDVLMGSMYTTQPAGIVPAGVIEAEIEKLKSEGSPE